MAGRCSRRTVVASACRRGLRSKFRYPEAALERDIQTIYPKSGSCLQAGRQFAYQFATIAGGVNLAGGVLAGLVAGPQIFSQRLAEDAIPALHCIQLLRFSRNLAKNRAMRR